MLINTFTYPKSICLFISSPYPNQVYDKEKTFLNGDLCVCCIMSCSEIFIFLNGVFQCPLGCNKKGLSPTMVGAFGKH